MADPIGTPMTPADPAPFVSGVEAWDPFQLMDRLDEEALKHELEGVASDELVYVVKEGGQEIVGLSKVGVDECCMALVVQGQCIREEDLQYEMIGEGADREALFKVKAARFAVSPAGVEVRLDQVIGVKRQPCYYEPRQLDLDAIVPSKKHKGKTYRQLLTSDDGRDYLGWMAENFQEVEIRDFVRALLAGEAVVTQQGRKLNPHWYEAGAMKAARNARFRLIPTKVRSQMIETARASGRARVVQGTGLRKPDATEQLLQQEAQRRAYGGGKTPAAAAPSPTPSAEPTTPATASTSAADPAATTDGPVSRVGPYAPTEKQIAYYQRLAESPVFTDEERRRALEWLATRATRQTIKDQIDWLHRQVETRRANRSA